MCVLYMYLCMYSVCIWSTLYEGYVCAYHWEQVFPTRKHIQYNTHTHKMQKQMYEENNISKKIWMWNIFNLLLLFLFYYYYFYFLQLKFFLKHLYFIAKTYAITRTLIFSKTFKNIFFQNAFMQKKYISLLRVLELEVFISKLGTVDRFSASSIVIRKVTL